MSDAGSLTVDCPACGLPVEVRLVVDMPTRAATVWLHPEWDHTCPDRALLPQAA